MSPEALELIATIRWMVGGAAGLLILVLGGLITVILQQRDQLAVTKSQHELTAATLARVELDVKGLGVRVTRLEQHQDPGRAGAPLS